MSLGLRQLDYDADLSLEDTQGSTIKASSRSGTANESISRVVLEGVYYIRVAAQEAGENEYVLRHGVAEPPLTATFEDVPQSHDGQTILIVELRFSASPDLSYEDVRNHVLTVTDGEVTNAARLEQPSNIRWEIEVSPDSAADVTVTLPVTTDCAEDGAVCMGDGRKLSSAISATIPGPVQNNPATGAPTISGTAQVGETLTASTSGIARRGRLGPTPPTGTSG